MKKEFLILLQFVLIVVFVGYGFFVLLLLQGISSLSLWDEYELVLGKWIFSFIVLSFIRLAVYFFTFRKETYDLMLPNSKDLIGKELSRTIQYLIIAVFSVLVSFYLSLINLSAMINISEAWLSIRWIFFAWLIGFSIFSFLRLGVIYIVNKPFQVK